MISHSVYVLKQEKVRNLNTVTKKERLGKEYVERKRSESRSVKVG